MRKTSDLGERLLALMDQKHHWAFPVLTRPGLSRSQLLVHFRHEYVVYVRDFPILIARVLGQVPPIPSVRASLAENIYEEQTGGLSKSAAHPELFLRMMEGLGFSRAEFENEDTWLHPAGRYYRDFLRQSTGEAPWQAAVALMTIFVEGSVNERAELAGTYKRSQGEDAVRKHPLVLHYGCPPSAMELTRAHAAVEGGHRSDAWRSVLDHTADGSAEARAVLDVCQRALVAWHRYRDGVAEHMKVSRDDVAA